MYRHVYTKPQHENFKYNLDRIACEGRKTIKNINSVFVDHNDQSALNMFLTGSPWSVNRLENIRMAQAMR